MFKYKLFAFEWALVQLCSVKIHPGQLKNILDPAKAGFAQKIQKFEKNRKKSGKKVDFLKLFFGKNVWFFELVCS